MSSELKKTRTLSKSAFTRAKNNLNKAITQNSLLKTVESRYGVFKLAWEEVQSCHERYVSSLDEENIDETWIEELNEIFGEIEFETDNYLDELENRRLTEEKYELRQKKDDEENMKIVDKRRNDELQKENVKTMNLLKRDQESLKFQKVVESIEMIIARTTDERDISDMVTIVEDLLLKLQRCSDSCCETHHSYVLSIDTLEEREKESKWLNNNLDIFHRTYERGKLFSKKKINLKSAEKSCSHKMKMKKLDFESFDGDIRRYPRFKEQFVKHIRPIYEADEEAFVLRSFLSREIKDEIDNLGENAKEIWKRLDHKYGNLGKLIDAILSDFKTMKKCDNNNPLRTVKFINIVEKAHRDLIYLDKVEEINNATIIGIIEEKLPEDIETEWIKLVTSDDKELIQRDKFSYLLKLLIQFRERIEYKSANLRSTSNVGYKEQTNNIQTEEFIGNVNNRKAWCWLHPDSTDHPIWRCIEFQNKPVEERLALVKSNRACYSCLTQGHAAKSCRRKFTCREEGCKLTHHKLLHEAHTSGMSFHGLSKVNKSSNTLLQLQKIKGSNKNGKLIDMNILWDTGSTLSFITFQVAERLNLVGTRERLQIVKVGGEVEDLDSFRYKFIIVDKLGGKVEIVALGLDRISTDIVNIKYENVNKLFQNVNLEDYSRPESGEVDCLIGFDYASLHPVRQQAIGNLLLLKNRFGNIIAGTHPTIQEDTKRVITHAAVHHIRLGFSDFYALEQLGIQCFPICGGCKCGKCHPGGKNMSLKEEREYNMIVEGLQYSPSEQRWEARYPFIKDPRKLPNNKIAALKMLYCTEKRLKQATGLACMYKEQINDMLQRGACRLLEQYELENYEGPIFYIAHHAVLKPSSKSTPCRIVFNSSANFQGHVLNEYYAKGPQMLNNLLGILLRFREERFAFIGDIRKMYHSVKITLADQMTHLFLWRDLDETKKPEEYAITVVNFGDKPSGAIAIAALRKTADMGENISSEACTVIKDNSYMDDILGSVKSQMEVQKLISDMDKILKQGGFQIKEWIINQDQNHDSQITEMNECTDITKSLSKEKVLGLNWELEKDEFSFKAKLNFSKKQRKLYSEPDLMRNEIYSNLPVNLTKRQILAQVNGIFDPLGLLSPFVVKAKILLRKLWGQDKKYGWDESIPPSFVKEWITFFTELYEVEDIGFKRCVKPHNTVGDPNLIIFSDGSGEIYGAVAYIRWELDDGNFQTYLLTAKNRIAPLKVIDVVRLELCGAVVGKRLRMFILNEMRYKFKRIYHILDSEIVKAMISKESYGFNTFAANRIGEIQQHTYPQEWFWLSGKLNIADCVTRGKSPRDLDRDSVWQSGPSFLNKHEDEWPISNQYNVNDLPERPKHVYTVTNVKGESLVDSIDINRFSTLQFLLNTTARVISLYRRFKRESENNAKEIQVIDVKEAERLWIIDAQKQLGVEMKMGKYKKLCPQVENGIIVVGGRAERWMSATWNRQRFILLPYNHRLSRLITEQKHKETGHLGVSATVARVRSKFWIIKLRMIAERVSSLCVTCKEKFKRLHGQIMSELPIERLKPAPAFSSTGCDYFGPFIIKGEVQKRVRGKCYGVIFTCLVTRAVYVDISSNYSTDGFLQVLRRFACMHGWPRLMYSDCGSQLKGASKELKETILNIDKQKIREISLKHYMEWKFSSPDAPWMNGATEALIKSVKCALNASIGDHILSFSELQTTLFECGQLVNQRPIGHKPGHPDEGSYICPNDLLLGRASSETPQGPFNDRSSNKHRIDFIERLVTAFWKKWIRDCFPNLVIQPKWHTQIRNLEENDVVLIQDSNLIRGNWRMGIVKRTIPSIDNKIRRVIVAYKNFPSTEKLNQYKGTVYTEVERSVHRLILLVPSDEKDK